MLLTNKINNGNRELLTCHKNYYSKFLTQYIFELSTTTEIVVQLRDNHQVDPCYGKLANILWTKLRVVNAKLFQRIC